MTIVPPRGSHVSHRLRWRDPDSSKFESRALPPELSERQRTQEAIEVADQLAARKRELRQGATTIQRMTCEAAVARYFEVADLSAGAEHTYRRVTAGWVQWCGQHGIRQIHEVGKGRLREWGASRLKIQKRVAIGGGKPGRMKTIKSPRAIATINHERVIISSLFNELRRLEITRLTGQDIADSLRPTTEWRQRKPCLSLDECKRLIEVAIEHDRAPKTSDPVAVMCMLLLTTGMRVAEACRIRGRDCDVARNVIVVRAAYAKTRRERAVNCSISIWLTVMLKRWAQRPEDKILTVNPEGCRGALRRLRARGAPVCSPQTLRRTCGTITACAPSIFGSASLHQTAQRLGHSIVVCEKAYAGQLDIAESARTIEGAIGLDDSRAVEVLER